MSDLIAVAYDDVDTARNMLLVGDEFMKLPRIGPCGGRVIHSSLSDEAEARLRKALSVAAP